MANLFGINRPNTNLRKNVFDLSEKSLYTQSAGMIIPTFVKEVNPSEKVRVSVSALTRTLPLNSPAFVRMRSYFHFFFVPFKHLWSSWDNFITGVEYNQSSQRIGRQYDTVPTISLFKCIADFLGDGFWRIHPAYDLKGVDKVSGVDAMGYLELFNSSRLLDLLGYNFRFVKSDFVDLAPGEEDEEYNTLAEFVLGVFYNYSDLLNPNDFNSDGSLKIIGNRLSVEDLNSVQSAYMELYNKAVAHGYTGDSWSYNFDEFAYNLLTSYVFRSKSNELQGLLSRYTTLHNQVKSKYMISDSIFKIGEKMYSTKKASEVDAILKKLKSIEVRVNPFRLLAYQKIYQDFYKRDDYERTNPLAYNLDDLTNEDIANTNFDNYSERFAECFKLRYRWLPKDYFTGVVPSELFGVNTVLKNFDLSSARVVSDILPAGPTDETLAYISGNKLDTVNVGRGINSISTREIRAAFAIEKMLKLTRRAGGHDYISQISAHYGFEPPKGRGDKVYFLGGVASSIDMNEVLTTANTDKGVTGDAYGRGIGALHDGRDIEFTVPEHGVIMCVSSILPDVDYSSEGIDNFNTKFYRGDYFQPELQDLGLQPVMSYELQANIGADGIKDNGVLGFGPRYGEYKTSYDRLHGEFRNGRSLSAWSASSLLGAKNGVKLNTLLVNPKMLDRVFMINYDGTEMSDQFLVSSQYMCKIIRPMSVTGQSL